MKPIRVFLVGMMGAGKSYWSRRLAQQLGIAGYDLDEVIVHSEGRSIPDIFAQQGEAHFRNLEKNYLRSQLMPDSYVLATGGATPCFNDNMQWMKENGFVIFLNPPIALIVERVGRDISTRPSLAGAGTPEALHQKVQEIMERRLPFYSQAHIMVPDLQPHLDALSAILTNNKEE